MNNIKLNKREATERVFVVFDSNYQGMGELELKRQFTKEGYFVVPFHYFIDNTGEIYTGRSSDEVGSTGMIGGDTSLFIQVDAPSSQRMSEPQAKALQDLTKDYDDIRMSKGWESLKI